MTTVTNLQNHTRGVATYKLWWVTLVAAVTAFVGNFIVFFVAQNVLGLSLQVPQPPDNTMLVPLSIGPILGASLVPAIGAALLLAILGRFVNRPFRIFQIIAVVILLLSFGGPLNLPIGGAEKAVLMVMHVVTAVSIVVVLTRLGRA